MSDIVAKLSAPFPPETISWRVGSTMQDKSKGMALAYIDARDVQDRLNAVCGDLWQVRTPWSSGNKLACEIGIKIGDEWIWRGDGAGESDVEAEKGAFSDAFKRAAVRWGVGRYLYDIESPWVALKQHGKSYAIADSEIPKLQQILRRQTQSIVPAAKVEAKVDVKAEAEKIVRRLRAAGNPSLLDQIMDEHRDIIATFPQTTQTYISDLFTRQREGLELAI